MSKGCPPLGGEKRKKKSSAATGSICPSPDIARRQRKDGCGAWDAASSHTHSRMPPLLLQVSHHSPSRTFPGLLSPCPRHPATADQEHSKWLLQRPNARHLEHLAGDSGAAVLLHDLLYCCCQRHECVSLAPRSGGAPAPAAPLPSLSLIPLPNCLRPPPPPSPPLAESVTYGFFAIWTVLCCIAYTVGGTFVLRNLEMRTPLAVGFMLGVGVTLVNMLLVLAVMSGEGPMCDGKPSSVRSSCAPRAACARAPAQAAPF